MITGVNLLHFHFRVHIAVIQKVNIRVLYLREHSTDQICVIIKHSQLKGANFALCILSYIGELHV